MNFVANSDVRKLVVPEGYTTVICDGCTSLEELTVPEGCEGWRDG